MHKSIEALVARLPDAMAADAHRLARRIELAKAHRAPAADWARIDEALERSTARRLRHDHRRRGARAESQHRFPVGLPEAALAASRRSQAHHHVGNARR